MKVILKYRAKYIFSAPARDRSPGTLLRCAVRANAGAFAQMKNPIILEML
jgi:hypothetical protein